MKKMFEQYRQDILQKQKTKQGPQITDVSEATEEDENKAKEVAKELGASDAATKKSPAELGGSWGNLSMSKG